jgi:hypothetical protein
MVRVERNLLVAQRAQLLLQGAQQVGRRGQFFLLAFQPVDRRHQRRPVQLRKVHIHRQLLPQAIHLVIVFHFALERDDLRGVCRDARGQITLLLGQGGDLCIV